jgi:hypothetical protein
LENLKKDIISFHRIEEDLEEVFLRVLSNQWLELLHLSTIFYSS